MSGKDIGVFLLLLILGWDCGKAMKDLHLEATDQEVFWGADQYDFAIVLPASGLECFWHFAHQGEHFYLNFMVICAWFFFSAFLLVGTCPVATIVAVGCGMADIPQPTQLILIFFSELYSSSCTANSLCSSWYKHMFSKWNVKDFTKSEIHLRQTRGAQGTVSATIWLFTWVREQNMCCV